MHTLPLSIVPLSSPHPHPNRTLHPTPTPHPPRVLCLAYRDVNLPAETVEPAAATIVPSVDAAWQTMGDEVSTSETEDRCEGCVGGWMGVCVGGAWVGRTSGSGLGDVCPRTCGEREQTQSALPDCGFGYCTLGSHRAVAPPSPYHLGPSCPSHSAQEQHL